MTEELAVRLDAVRHWAREIITGQVPPIEGARGIAQRCSDELRHLAVFEELVSEWDRDEAGREDCEARMLEEASLIVADTA